MEKRHRIPVDGLPVDALKIISAIGKDRLAGELPVSMKSVDAARRKKLMPACWYRVVLNLCEEIKHPCPMDAFAMKRGVRAASKE